MHTVVSSNLAAAGYDDESKTLAIQFLNGSIYHYEEVPREYYEGIFKSDSPGAYFKQLQEKKKYKFKKLKLNAT